MSEQIDAREQPLTLLLLLGEVEASGEEEIDVAEASWPAVDAGAAPAGPKLKLPANAACVGERRVPPRYDSFGDAPSDFRMGCAGGRAELRMPPLPPLMPPPLVTFAVLLQATFASTFISSLPTGEPDGEVCGCGGCCCCCGRSTNDVKAADEVEDGLIGAASVLSSMRLNRLGLMEGEFEPTKMPPPPLLTPLVGIVAGCSVGSCCCCCCWIRSSGEVIIVSAEPNPLTANVRGAANGEMVGESRKAEARLLAASPPALITDGGNPWVESPLRSIIEQPPPPPPDDADAAETTDGVAPVAVACPIGLRPLSGCRRGKADGI